MRTHQSHRDNGRNFFDVRSTTDAFYVIRILVLISWCGLLAAHDIKIAISLEHFAYAAAL